MKKIQRLFNIFINIVVIVFIIINIFYAVSVINSKNNNYSTAGIWKLKFLEAKGQKGPSWIKAGDLTILYSSGFDSLRRGDIITYDSGDNNFITQRIAEVKDGNYVLEEDQGGSTVTPDMIIGRYMFKVPYVGYIMEHAKTRIGLIVSIAIPCIIVLIYVSIIAADAVHNLSRHRKRILRKKRRRNIRYKKEGLYWDKRAVI